jgi:DNA-binding transcriptional MerR regulator
MRQADLLDPVDVTARLDRLDLYLGQVCSVAGISKIQLDYWTEKAAIPTKGRKQRTYDMRAVELVMLIKQARDKGMTLAAAIAAAREFQERRGSGPPPLSAG